MQKVTFRCLAKAWLIWGVAASFYSFEFFIRISPSVMINDLMRTFATDAAIAGSFSALYYYAYASMQIPAGLLLDRYGIRPLLTVAAMLVVMGSLLFATTHTLFIADVSRILMGIGSAFSFIGCLKLVRNWFTERHIAIVIGLTNTLGIIGALGAEAPLAFAIDHVGWRSTMLIAGGIGAILALTIRLVVRDKPSMLGCCKQLNTSHEKQETGHILPNLKYLLSSPRIWLTAIYGGLMVAPISAFTELWSVPFFMQVDGLSRTTAAAISSLVFIGIGIGGPLHGWLSGKIGKRKPVLLMGTIGAFLCFITIIYLPYRHEIFLSLTLLLFGFFTSSMLLTFSMNTEHNTAISTGLVIGFTNMIIMLGGTIFQPLVGYLLDQYTSTVHSSQLNIYAYQHALVVLPACQLLAMILLRFVPEKGATVSRLKMKKTS